jgi:hypothetical protein
MRTDTSIDFKILADILACLLDLNIKQSKLTLFKFQEHPTILFCLLACLKLPISKKMHFFFKFSENNVLYIKRIILKVQKTLLVFFLFYFSQSVLFAFI